ncbi:hypothetical protein TRV_02870 [Trichophyton verrucosum HKI 0517]|uniref:Uncharacterized protein n=1 Tax=Trichophyton verrucosum (strain HKI 0517) TaxID=663202 RepID=D4D6Z2_TRIVH|nr:uncharacterized protein TRV_02870 [Trichophyton verrucosum HKI 0517]EFE42430.1 hypothetical protein TRV_02870 [Trichophyton verrucosum HKI 0517]
MHRRRERASARHSLEVTGQLTDAELDNEEDGVNDEEEDDPLRLGQSHPAVVAVAVATVVVAWSILEKRRKEAKKKRRSAARAEQREEARKKKKKKKRRSEEEAKREDETPAGVVYKVEVRQIKRAADQARPGQRKKEAAKQASAAAAFRIGATALYQGP